MSQRVNVSGKVKAETAGAVAKASLNRANELLVLDTKPKRATHEQAEAKLILRGGPNAPMLQNWAMTCG